MAPTHASDSMPEIYCAIAESRRHRHLAHYHSALKSLDVLPLPLHPLALVEKVMVFIDQGHYNVASKAVHSTAGSIKDGPANDLIRIYSALLDFITDGRV